MISIYIYIDIDIYIRVPSKARRGCQVADTGVTGGCVPPCET